MLGNGSLTVGLNENGLVHDFYYPYVGLDNLTTSRSAHHKIGVWVDGVFSWVDDGSWEVSIDFESDALISSIQMHSEDLRITILAQDFVDNEFNAFCRQLTVINKAEHERDIRLFMHQVFQISRAGRADTALYEPDEHYILDYKGRCSLLVYGQDHTGNSYDQFAIGNYGIEGKEGTYRDAEDGELSGSAVEHGGVDSVIRFGSRLAANTSRIIDYWIIASDSQFAAEEIHQQLRAQGLSKRMEKTRQSWHDWLAHGQTKLDKIDKEYLDITKKSLLIIKAHIDKRGGVIASCDSSIYNYGRDYYSYVWPRDGAYALWPLIRMGYYDEAKKFFEFCRDILTRDGYLMHKYQPDRAIGSTWHPLLHQGRKELAIQEDETAIVIYMLAEFFHYSKDEDFVRNLYSTLIQPACNFMTRFIDEETGLPHASYDLWEEKFLTSTYTTAAVSQALQLASEFAEEFEYADDAVRWRQSAEKIAAGAQVFFDPSRNALRKGFLQQPDGSLQFDNTLDVSSLYGAMMFDLYEDKSNITTDTVHAIENILLDKSPAKGCPRYEYDHYFESDIPYMGNPWFVTTLWLAQYYVRDHQADKAKSYIDWVLQHTAQSGVLSEQINPETGSPVSVMPLVWSHAELVNTILDLSHNKNSRSEPATSDIEQ
jgi:GH15 family glucan-1,4-alpha-glucosidase